jgi:hypothetical protein
MHHVKDVVLEPNPKTVFGGTIPKMEVLDEWCLTNTNLVLDPRQARSIISLLISKMQLSTMLYILLH